MSRRRQKRMATYLGESSLLADGRRHVLGRHRPRLHGGAGGRRVGRQPAPLRLQPGLAAALLAARRCRRASASPRCARILKLWLFVPPQFSGVRSAGNGPAMRSAILGVAFSESDPLLVMHVSASSAITHSDPRAQCGALAVALAARSAMRGEIAEEYLFHLERFAAPFGDAGKELVGARAARRGERRGRRADGQLRRLHRLRARGERLHVPLGAGGAARLARATRATSRPRSSRSSPAAATPTRWRRSPAASSAPASAAPASPNRTSRACGTGRAARAGSRRRRATRSPRPTARLPKHAALPARRIKLLGRNLFFLGVVLAHGFRRLLPPY